MTLRFSEICIDAHDVDALAASGATSFAFLAWLGVELALRALLPAAAAAAAPTASPFAGAAGIVDLTQTVIGAYRGVFTVARRFCLFVFVYAVVASVWLQN